MKRMELLEASVDILRKAGFYVGRIQESPRVSFDLIARRDDLLILVRVVVNIDSLSRETGNELKIIAHYLNTSPFVVGEKSTSAALEPGLVYTRYDIPMINIETLEDLFFYGVRPFSHSAHGGFYVTFNGELLRKIRMERKISLSTLAEKAGVSKRAIQMYESGMDASIDAALHLEEFLGETFVRATDIFSRKYEGVCYRSHELSKCNTFEKEVLRALERMGTHVIPIFRCPFDALTGSDDSIIITGISPMSPELIRRIELLSTISIICEKRSMFVVDELKSRRNVKGTPLVGKKEIDNLEGPEDMDRLIEDRAK